MEHIINENGKLWHRWRDGEQLYREPCRSVFYISGLLELYDATLDVVYIAKVIGVNR